MRRIVRVSVGLVLVWMLGAPMRAESQAPAAAGAGSQVTARLVVFEAFMRPT